MIYFKVSSIIVDSNNESLSTIISTAKLKLVVKIGYTDDNDEIAKKRDASYKTENPSIIHYKYILEGTREDEFLIHEHLKNYLYAGREWFRLTSEVIEFIEEVNTIEDVREKVKNIKDGIEIKKDYQEKSKVLYPLIPAILSVTVDNLDNYFTKYYELSDYLRLIKFSDNYEKDIISIIEEDYPTKFQTILNNYNINKSFSDNKFMERYSNLTNFTEKVKSVCEYAKSNNIENIKYTVDDEIINFYLKLGPSKLGTLSYQRSKILNELGRSEQENSELLLDLVYSQFNEGDRISRSKLKIDLNNIYKQAGISDRKVKASTIEEFFEVERTRVTNEITKKRDEGFKLIKKK